MARPESELGHEPTPGGGGAARGRPETDEALWARFAEASTVDGFCQGWLAIQCRLIDGVSSGLLLLGTPETGPFAPAAVWPRMGPRAQRLGAAAERALRERRSVVQPVEEPGDGSRPPGRTRLHVAYPVEADGRLHGAVVVELDGRVEGQLEAALRQLQWGFAWLEVLLRREQAAADASGRQRLETILDLLAVPLAEERFQAAATAFVTALATRLDCDRVSLGVARRGRVRVRALSHSAHLGRETNLVHAIATAMDEALDQPGAVVHPAPAAVPPRITRAHAELAAQHGGAAVCSVRLEGRRRILGVLTLERPADRPFDQAAVEMCEALAAAVGPSLEVLERDDRWIAVKVAQAAAGWLGALVGRGHLGLKLAAIGVAAAAVFLSTATWEYRVSADTRLEPAVRRAVVAPFNGYIAEAAARAGDIVSRGQPLAALEDRELALERLRWLGQLEQARRQHQEALAERKAAQVGVLAAEIDQARAQLALLDDQLSRTRLVAPFDGVVVTGDLSQSLGAPVERGQVLFEVAPLDAYRVVLEVDERDIAEVAPGQAGALVLSGAPDRPLPLRVETVTPLSTAEEGRNYFRVEARLEAAPDGLRPGLEGVAKVDIDRRLLVWIWTHRAVDWLRLTLWAWLP